MDWSKDIWTQEASTWTCLEFGLRDVLPERSVVAPNSGYLSVFLKSLQLKNVRKGLVRFSGAVHSFISIPHLSGNTASFHVFTSPASLQNIDSKNADRILVMDQRLLGPLPYRGGDLNVQVGLFSIRESDVTDAYIKVLEPGDALAILFDETSEEVARVINDAASAIGLTTHARLVPLSAQRAFIEEVGLDFEIRDTPSNSRVARDHREP
jgi:hypothetical protein